MHAIVLWGRAHLVKPPSSRRRTGAHRACNAKAQHAPIESTASPRSPHEAPLGRSEGGSPRSAKHEGYPVSAVVVCSEIEPACLELRSAALTLMAVVLKTCDLERLGAQLERRAAVVPGLFDDEPVTVDLSQLRETQEELDFGALVVLLCQHGMRPIAVRGGSLAQTEAAYAAGLIEAPEGARPALREVAPPQPQIIERVVEVQLQPLPPLVIDKPLRSGQQVHAQGRDLIVRALVSF